MANAVGFEGANQILRAPAGDENCRDLEILRTDDSVVSCWRLTPEELENVMKTGVVWLSIVGVTHPPLYISGENFVTIDGRPVKAEPHIEKAVIGGKLDG